MVIENLELVKMCMSKELGRYRRLISTYDGVVVSRPNLQAVRMSRRNMTWKEHVLFQLSQFNTRWRLDMKLVNMFTYDMHFFSIELSRLQLVNKPLQFRGRIRTVQ